ncbi:MAG: type II toxin-antitoxin system RelE/ParE family toxin [Candidatus Brockarchaeota archaeon]|nr:type II toxin-antitoxin system RelE/ParE family toxin [Candidatus Brockarchaeota archaeon]
MTYRILVHKNAVSFLRQLDSRLRDNIVEHLKQLEDFPRTRLDVVKIAGEENTFRLRVGKYRVLFRIYEEEKVIVIVKADLRSRIYK